MPAHPSTRGFTLIELLVVIAIIGVFSAVVLSSLNIARGRAKDAARMTNVQSVKTALELYYSDNNRYPAVGDPDTAVMLHNLMDPLAPQYINSVSLLLMNDYDMYVWAGVNQYGLYIYTDANGWCKTGVNMTPGWWGETPDCKF